MSLYETPGFPHKGWKYNYCEDLDGLDGNCDICGTAIRYVHHLSHPLWNNISVGCMCSEKLISKYAFEKVKRNDKWMREKAGNLGFNKYLREREVMRRMLPTYDKSKRKKTFEQLPKGAYVVKIIGAKQEQWPSGDGVIRIAFDIAEGEYKDFYDKQFKADTREDKKWPFDAVYSLNIPDDKSPEYISTNWSTFFADLEDSNNGFVFGGDIKTLKGKIIGGKFRIKQTEYKGNVYDHTEMIWTCIADDVRTGNAGKMPNDKLVSTNKSTGRSTVNLSGDDDFISVPEGAEEELPF